MYHDKSKVSNLIFNKLLEVRFTEEGEVDDKGVALTSLLNNNQIYQLTLHIMQNLPMTDFEAVKHFHKAFQVKKEDNLSIIDFKYSELRFKLLLEEVLELGFSLGLSYIDIYTHLIKVYSDTKKKEITPSISEVLDALTDILFVAYGALDVFNLTDVQHSAMQEVYHSNMTKLISTDTPNYMNIVMQSINEYKHKGIEVVSKDLKNGYIAIVNKETRKILKPVTYVSPDLKKLLTQK